MPDYVVRVELRGNLSYDEYESLHALMAQKGFQQTVAGTDNQGNNKKFALPHATYYGSSNNECSSVRAQSRKQLRPKFNRTLLSSWCSRRPGQLVIKFLISPIRCQRQLIPQRRVAFAVKSDS